MRWAIWIGLALAVPASASAQGARRDDPVPPMRVHARHEVMIRWAPRYQLDTSTDPLGLEQRMWRRVEMLPMVHRVALNVRNAADGLLSLHFAGWGALDLFADSEGGIAAGDVAIGYVELDLAPVRLWAGRRFIVFGPPGGLHVDGGGASVRSDEGLVAEAFVGRPVTPARTSLLGPSPDFSDATVAYGARVGYADAGRLGASVSYAELWGEGILGSRILDLSAYWVPGDLRIEGTAKVDLRSPGLAQGRLGAALRASRHVTVDADYLHVEPGRWIPPWSILSVFETTVFDEVAGGVTVRPIRPLALRLEGAGRLYSAPDQQPGEPRVGYRVDLRARVLPVPLPGIRLNVLVSRRDDGTLGYTVIWGGAAFDPWPRWTVALDGAFAMDDQGGRDSAIGRATVEVTPSDEWALGLTASVARSPIVPAETRAMLRARWTPELP